MRMFLVGMCDIFLILYLTAMGQIDERLVSDLTVDDYEQVVEAQKELEAAKAEVASQLEALRIKFSQTQQKLSEASFTRDALESTTGDLQQKLDALRNESARKREELEKALQVEEANRKAQQASLTKLERSLEQERQAAQATAAKLAEEQRAREAAAARAEQVSVALEQRKEELEAAHRAAEQEREALIKEKERALQEKQEAESQALAASLAAAESDEARSLAERRAREATSNAYSSRIAETLAKADLRTERAVRKKSQRALTAVSRAPEEAYRESIQSRLQTIRVRVTSENALLGESTEDATIETLPVEINGDWYLVAPEQQLGIDADIPSRRFKNISLSVANRKASELCRVGSKRQGLLGIKVPIPASSSVPAVDSPVWLAIRNGSRLPFADRWREQSEDFVTVRTDRLESKGALLQVKLDGSRGYGDYASRVVRGDTLADMTGRVRGVAVGVNNILPVAAMKPIRCVSTRLDASGVVSLLRE